MFNYLVGTITEKTENNKITIELNHIGYEIVADNELYNSEEESVKAYVIMIPGEDEFRMYGFKNKTKRKLFNLLRSVSGLGSKTAIKILSVVDSIELIEAVTFNNTDFLKKLPGIGKKTADRIVLELKSKMKELTTDENLVETLSDDSKIQNMNVFQESLEGLVSLGYSSAQSRIILKELMSQNENYSVQQLIKDALKKFFDMKK